LADHIVATKDYWHAKLADIVPGDYYFVQVLGGIYELVTKATSYGTGVVVERQMADTTEYVAERAAITANGPVVMSLTTGTLRFSTDVSGTGHQVWFGRCDKF
jgi:hypothetical protein